MADTSRASAISFCRDELRQQVLMLFEKGLLSSASSVCSYLISDSVRKSNGGTLNQKQLQSYAEDLLLSGDIYAALDSPEQALADYMKALNRLTAGPYQADSLFMKLQLRIARYEMKRKNYSAVIMKLGALCTDEATFPVEGLALLAEASEREGRLERAIFYWTMVLRSCPVVSGCVGVAIRDLRVV